MKRLVKKSEHDWNNRDMAIVYIDGKVYEDATHGICLQRYMEDNNIDDTVDLRFRPEVEQFSEISMMNDGQDVILAHRVDKTNEIYFIYGLKNGNDMSDSEIKADLSKVYPDREIINDMDHDDSDNHGYNEEEQVEKGMERMQNFKMKEINALVDSGKFKMMEYDDTLYNEYCLIDYYLYDDAFKIETMLDVGLDTSKYYELNELNKVVEEAENKLKSIYDKITKLGFELSEEYLVEDREFYFTKMVGNTTLELNGGGEEFMFTADYLNVKTEEELSEFDIYANSSISMEQIPKLVEVCERTLTAKLKNRLKKRGN